MIGHSGTDRWLGNQGAEWQFTYPAPTRYEVICHNDVAPYNTVFVDAPPRALIDFDTAGPGPRVWDVVYAAYTLGLSIDLSIHFIANRQAFNVVGQRRVT